MAANPLSEHGFDIIAIGASAGGLEPIRDLSLARHAGNRTIGVVLSGMLKDGALGLKAIKEAGGMALVQAPEEAAYPQMPRSAIQYDGPVDFIGPVQALAGEIRRLVLGAPILIPARNGNDAQTGGGPILE